MRKIIFAVLLTCFAGVASSEVLMTDTSIKQVHISTTELLETSVEITLAAGEDIASCANKVMLVTNDFIAAPLTYELLYTTVMTAYANPENKVSLAGHRIDDICYLTELTLR